jgi:hypothetical protein
VAGADGGSPAETPEKGGSGGWGTASCALVHARVARSTAHYYRGGVVGGGYEDALPSYFAV